MTDISCQYHHLMPKALRLQTPIQRHRHQNWIFTPTLNFQWLNCYLRLYRKHWPRLDDTLTPTASQARQAQQYDTLLCQRVQQDYSETGKATQNLGNFKTDRDILCSGRSSKVPYTGYHVECIGEPRQTLLKIIIQVSSIQLWHECVSW